MSEHQKNLNGENSEVESAEKSTIFTVNEDVKPAKKASKYGRLIKPIAFLLALALVATGSIFAVKYLWPVSDDSQDTTEETTEKSTIRLTESANVALEDMKNAKKDAISNILKISVKSSGGTVEVVPYKSDDSVLYKMTGYDNIPQNSTTLTTLSQNIFEFNAVKKLDEKWTKADCGLENPQVEVKVYMADGSDFDMYLGDKVPDGNSYYYGCTSMADGIYIMDSDCYTNLNKKVNDFVETTLISAVSQSGDNDPYFNNNKLIRYDSITFSGSHLENDIKLNYVESQKEALLYRVVAPVSTYADDEKISDILSPLSGGMTASEALVLNPDSADLKEYGLDKPYSVITYVVKGKTYTLKISKPDIKTAGYSACMVDDVPVIYSLMTSLYEFVDWDLSNIRSSMLFLRDISTVKSVTAEYGGKKVKYDISYDEVISDNSDGDSTSSTTSAPEKKINVVCNSTPVVAEYFQNIYQQIILLSPMDYLKAGESAPKTEPYLKLTYEYNDADQSDVVELVKYSDRYYCFTVNGIGDALIRYDSVDSVVNNFEKLQKGEAVGSPT